MEVIVIIAWIIVISCCMSCMTGTYSAYESPQIMPFSFIYGFFSPIRYFLTLFSSSIPETPSNTTPEVTPEVTPTSLTPNVIEQFKTLYKLY